MMLLRPLASDTSLSDPCPERFCLWNADDDVPLYKFSVYDKPSPIKFCQQDFEFSVQVIDSCSLPPKHPFKEARITTVQAGGFTTSKKEKKYPLMSFGDRVSAQNVFGRDMDVGIYNLDAKVYFGNTDESNDIDFEIVDRAVDPSCIDVETALSDLEECIEEVPWME